MDGTFSNSLALCELINIQQRYIIYKWYIRSFRCSTNPTACFAEHFANQLSPSKTVTSLVWTSFPGMKAKGPNGTYCWKEGGRNKGKERRNVEERRQKIKNTKKYILRNRIKSSALRSFYQLRKYILWNSIKSSVLRSFYRLRKNVNFIEI